MQKLFLIRHNYLQTGIVIIVITASTEEIIMPITTTWYDTDHRAIVMRYDGKWSWDELNHELAVLIDLSASVSHELVILNELSQTSFVPEENNIAQGTNF